MIDILFSLIIFVFSFICLYLSLKSNKKNKASFDEMQKNVRQTAYKFSFFSLLFFNVLVSILEQFKIILFDSFTTTSFMGILVSLFVFSIICINKDSYIAIYENFNVKISLFFLIGIVCAIFFIYNLLNGLLLSSGLLTFRVCYGLVSFIFIFLGIFLIIKNNIAAKEN